MHQEHEHERKMADVRRDITSQFKAIAVDLEQQIEGQLHEFETQVYGQLEQNIAEARQQTETAISTSNTELAQLAAVRHKLESILQDVQKAATPLILSREEHDRE
jgi:uridine kinase